jgi:Threonine dehydrogenase and related Zn-dependent dehydrogenases
MRAIAVFPANKEIAYIEHPEPQITRPEQVKLKVLDVGICGTDRHICTFHFGELPADSPYLIPGHEALAEVSAVGSAVTELHVGDLVVPEVRRPCLDSTCRACRAGQQDYCYSGTYQERGIQGLHGYMTEMVVEENTRHLHRVPAHLRDVAVLTEPLTIAEKAYAQILQIQQRLPWFIESPTSQEPGRGLKALVLGAGPIGLLGAMLFVSQGFETLVYSRATLPNTKATLVHEIGATYVSSTTTTPQELTQQYGPIDVVYEAVDAAPLAIEILPYLNRNAIYLFTSPALPEQPFGIDAATALHTLTGYNQVIVGTVNAGPATFTAAIEHLALFQQHWPQTLSTLITERVPLDQARTLLTERQPGIKYVVNPWR